MTYVVCSEPPDQAGLNGRHDRVLDDGGVLSVGFSRLMPSRISTGRGEGGEGIARKLSRRSGRSICSRQTNMSTEMGAVAMLGKKCALHQVHH